MIFSVVIPTYNRRSVIGECIDSVLNQPEAQRGLAEIIIVDDSTDDTLAVAARAAERQPACRLVTHKDVRRLGVTGARNKGIDLATGDVIVLLDSDDQLTMGALSYLTTVLQQHEEIDILFGSIVNKSGKPLRRREDFLDRFVTYEELIQDDGVGEFIPVIRRKVLVDSGMRYAAEAEGSEGILYRRLARAGHKIWYSSQVLRLYDDVGVDRNSTVELRVKRARAFAIGHIIELKEFGPDLRRLNRAAYAKKVLKVAIYNRFAQPPDPKADAYLRGSHGQAFRACQLFPRPLVRQGFEWFVRANLARRS